LKILILNGPNLNRLGLRKPEIYGSRTMAQILLDIQHIWPEVHFVYRQSNHEGDLIDWLQDTNTNDERPTTNDKLLTTNDPCDGIVLNAGGYSHTSVALRDAVEDCPWPVVEVHISEIAKREPFRRTSLLTEVCAHSIIGHGTDGYREAVEWIISHNKVQI